MPRRSRRSDPLLAGTAGIVSSPRTLLRFAAIACAVAFATPARAEWKPAGALTASLLVESGGGGTSGPAIGGGLATDLWQTFGALRLGLYTGLHAVSGTDEQALVFTPFAFSGAIVLE